MILIADTRERAVIEHGFGDEYEVKVEQMTVGDYAIAHENRILAIIERKTLTDFAASITDGRMNNREKLKKLRDETGCAVYFIIEGRHGKIGPETVIANSIRWRQIESSIFHMQMRDGFHFIFTFSISDTAQTLFRFMKSLSTLPNYIGGNKLPTHEEVVLTADAKVAVVDNRTGTPLRIEGEGGASVGEVLGYIKPPNIEALLDPNISTKDVIERLKEKVTTPDDAVVLELWRQLPMVGNVTACVLASNFTIADLFNGELASKVDEITINGRKLKESTVKGIKNINSETKCKLLKALPRWSGNSATAVLAKHNNDMMAILADKELYSVQVSKTKLGASKVAILLKYMNMKI